MGCNVDEPKNWLAYLDLAFAGDRATIDCLQEWFGYCRSDDTSFQMAAAMISSLRSGKATIACILKDVVGKEFVCMPKPSIFSDLFGINILVDKKLAIFPDMRIPKKINCQDVFERIVGIVGEDPQTIDQRYRSAITMKLPTRLMFVSNTNIDFFDQNGGAFASRLLVFRPKHNVLLAENHNLSARLLGELSAIQQWAAVGYDRLISNGQFTRITPSDLSVNAA